MTGTTARADARIAVIGAGAKAAAIAAKADCLRNAGVKNIEVTIFEQADEAAANWSGQGGYTDGKLELCTPTVHDLGYPYDTGAFSPAVTEDMQARYSWMRFAVRHLGGSSEGRWADLMEARPSHLRFAEYLQFAIAQSRARLETGWTVDSLSVTGGKWSVSAIPTAGGPAKPFGDFDGVVVTGPGPANTTVGNEPHPLLFNGKDVWQRLPQLVGAIQASREPIVVVGAGGAAASIVAWLISAGFENRTFIFVANQAAIYTRSPGYFEQLVFEAGDDWKMLGKTEREEFVKRLTRSVVWEAVAERLKRASAIIMAPGRAQSMSDVPADAGMPAGIQVTYQASNDKFGLIDVEGCVVIDAAGFNPWWFKDLLPSPWKDEPVDAFKGHAEGMDDDLCLTLAGLPPLHVPTCSQAIGPGFGSLLVLGEMADRVLSRYVYGAAPS